MGTKRYICAVIGVVVVSTNALYSEGSGKVDDPFAADPFAQPAPVQPKPAGLTPEVLDQLPQLPGDIGALPPVPENPDNPSTPEKVALGRELYFDSRLSVDGTLSCASCHHPSYGYGDGLPRTFGMGGKELGRHSPTVLNAAYNSAQFWDGRAQTLEEQAQGPIMASAEMAMPSEEELIQRLEDDANYQEQFQLIFGESPNLANIAKAIAAFEKTLVTPDSPFDRYAAGDKDALTPTEKRGLALFVGKASCTACHNGVNFSDNLYHNLGVFGEGPAAGDPGRFAVSGQESDRHAFKTPTARNAELTSPYMHDGSIKTLKELVEFYNKGGGDMPNKSPLIRPLELTESEVDDLVAFLRTLTGKQPELPHGLAEATPVVTPPKATEATAEVPTSPQH